MILRAGVIGSSGGSALAAAEECIVSAGHSFEPVVVVDRECGMYDWARRRGFACHLIEYRDADGFSERATRCFAMEDCRDILLFYSRRVSSPLIDDLRVWNIHPSLLPAFPGLGAVSQALAAGVKVLGATLHRVDAGLDTGPVVAQVVTSMPQSFDSQSAHRLSYQQKVWLTLNWFEMIASCNVPEPSNLPAGPGVFMATADICDPSLRKSYLNWVQSIEEQGSMP